MKRRLISFILLLLLTSFLTAFPQLSLPVKAAETSGKCGENLTWSFDKSTGNLTITGSGDMMLDINESRPWRLSASASDIKSVSLPKGLTSIGEAAFSGCSSLTRITIPESVTSIGEAAFSGCSSLTRITIPESVTNIGRFAFLGCSSLKSITIPDSVVDIDYGAFFDCSSLTSMTIPDSVVYLHGCVFSGCSSLTDITLSDNMTNIEGGAFRGCSSLKSITIPDSVVYIDNSAFSDCSSLTSMTIPDSVVDLGDFVFSGCSSLTNIVIPSGVMHIGLGPFYKCSKLRSISVAKENSTYCSDTEGVLFNKDKVLLIAYPCGKTERKYIVPSSVSTIDNYAFSFSSALTNVEFPGEIRFFGEEAFYHCNNLKSVSLPDSVIRIRDKAFDECFSLEDIYFSGTKAKWEQIDIREGNTPLLNATIHYESAAPVVPGGEGGGSESGDNPPSILEECLKRPATVYDNELALIAAKLSLKIYDNNHVNDESVKGYLTYDLGFKEENIYSRNYGSSYAFTIAKKEYAGDDADEIIVIVAQGTTELREVYGDAFGEPDYDNARFFGGFAPYKVVEAFYAEIVNHDYAEPVNLYSLTEQNKRYKILLTGHSLGGAVANLLAANLTSRRHIGGVIGQSDVFCYTFGAIDSIAVSSPVTVGYENIHNIYNEDDTLSPLNFGWLLFNGSGSRNGKFGVIEPFQHDYRTEEDLKKRDYDQLRAAVNHNMANYLEAVENNRVLESSFRNPGMLDLVPAYSAIGCPVDIEVYCNGKLVGRTVNNEIDTKVTSIPIIIDNDKKFVIYPDQSEYNLRISAYDDGSMVYFTQEMTGSRQVKLIEKISLTKGKLFSCEVGGTNKLQDLKLFVVDSEGIPIAEVQEDGTEVSVINPFVDVKDSAYYYNAVLWAVNHDPQITNGTNATHFSPDSTCTRAQVVTFLWRANGCPEPVGKDNPFTDVKPDAYYYKAVLWAVENGITTGTSSTTFSPNSGCTRGQVVTFLWRASGQSEPKNSDNPFNDVRPDAYYYRAVLWAVENEVTNGTSADKFSPNATCTRAQIVTFLYRAIL